MLNNLLSVLKFYSMIVDLLYYLGLILCDFVLLAFRSFGDFVLLEFWWLEVTRRCGEVVLWCSGGELVFRWHLVFAPLVCG
jgi:hypothetical protein